MTSRVAVKKLLKSYIGLKIRHSQNLATIELLVKKYPSGTSNYTLETGHVQGGLPKNETQTLAIKNVELDEKSERLTSECADIEYTLKIIDNAMRCLSDFEADLVRQYFFMQKKPIEIADDYKHSRQWVILHLDKSIVKLDQVMSVNNILLNKFIPVE